MSTQDKSGERAAPDAHTPNWSGASAHGGFSLADAVRKAGLPHLGTFLSQVAEASNFPELITGYSQGLSKYGNQDEFRTCLARLTYAASFGHASVSNDAVSLWVKLSNQSLSPSVRLKANTCKLLSDALWTAIDKGRGTSGLGVVHALSEVEDLWGSSAGTGPTGDDLTAARLVSVMTVILVMSHVVQSAEAKRLVGESLAGMNPSGTYVSVPLSARSLWQFGRAWADANGIDFDEFYRRHEGLDD